ncbi:MAG: hypothetical protein QM537_07645 [Candidatus Symbiobacter sp.]|nr:hypothetical protein [Candidatus Symbiobacter sp.]
MNRINLRSSIMTLTMVGIIMGAAMTSHASDLHFLDRSQLKQNAHPALGHMLQHQPNNQVKIYQARAVDPKRPYTRTQNIWEWVVNVLEVPGGTVGGGP